MPLVPSTTLLLAAQKGGYAVPAFNAENLEMFQAVVRAAEDCRSPVILQTTPPTAKYIGLELAAAMARCLAESATIPVALHLDHGDGFELAMRAIHAGYTSIMFDGSAFPLAENIRRTADVVRIASPMGLSVEGELGSIGGKEDSLTAENFYTDPDEAMEFAAATHVDMFAVAIGAAHGFYKGEPRLDFMRLEEIRKRVKVPLVLHGASGLPDPMVRQAIGLGICKVNFATELRYAFTQEVRSVLKDQKVFDPKRYSNNGGTAVYELCKRKIEVCGSKNRL